MQPMSCSMTSYKLVLLAISFGVFSGTKMGQGARITVMFAFGSHFYIEVTISQTLSIISSIPSPFTYIPTFHKILFY